MNLASLNRAMIATLMVAYILFFIFRSFFLIFRYYRECFISLEEIGSKNSHQLIPNPAQKELTLKDDPTDALKIGPERGFFESIGPEEAGEEEGE